MSSHYFRQISAVIILHVGRTCLIPPPINPGNFQPVGQEYELKNPRALRQVLTWSLLYGEPLQRTGEHRGMGADAQAVPRTIRSLPGGAGSAAGHCSETYSADLHTSV